MSEELGQGSLFDSGESTDSVEESPESESNSNKEDNTVSESKEKIQEEMKPVNFQEALDRLQEVAQELESGELPLEDAMEHYREGQQLINFCEDRLEEAELLVEEIDDSGESPGVSPKEEPSE